jgi:uncharacterized RmlC-like cupin family protein
MMSDSAIEHPATCVCLRAGESFVGKQGFTYAAAISATPHLPYNMSQTEPATAVISRTDPNEQESVALLPELDAIHLAPAPHLG